MPWSFLVSFPAHGSGYSTCLGLVSAQLRGPAGSRSISQGRGLGGGVPVATQGPLEAAASHRSWASSLLSLPRPAGVCLRAAPSEPLVSRLGASAEPASPPAAPTQTLLRLFRPFVGQPHRPRSSLVTVGLACSSGEGEGEAGISDTVPRIQWEEVGHTWSLDSGTFSGTLLPESSSGWALFPVLSLRQGVHSLVVVLLSDLHPLLYFLIQFSFHKLLC